MGLWMDDEQFARVVFAGQNAAQDRAQDPSLTKLLIHEPPLQVLPSLAVKIGLNQAIFVQQLHYWLRKDGAHEFDGFRWVYNTYEGWQEQFPFWSRDTVKRVIRSLEKTQLVIATDKYNKMATDRTKWYTINYHMLWL